MKTLKNFIYLTLIALLAVSCERSYDAPPFTEPTYDKAANITIEQLKKEYGSTKPDAPTLIETDYILKAYVVGNDISGNIFKQLYVQDQTGGINLGVDQSNIYTTHRVGQEVFIELKGLSIVSYGGELQIGYKGTNANRISPLDFEAHVFLNSWPVATNATPTKVDLSNLTDKMVNTVVELDRVYFINGGKKQFTTGDQTTSEILKDENGKSIEVRTSQYSNFAKDMLPEGLGTVCGILGRYNGGWQFIVRSKDDLKNFNGELPKPEAGAIFSETFGTDDVTAKPKIADYKGYAMKEPVVYSGTGDLRMTKAFDNHVWMGAGEANLTIKGINTEGQSNLSLVYDMTANIYADADKANINILKVYYNGTALPVPSVVLDKAGGYGNAYYKVTLDISNMPVGANNTLEFKSSAADNVLGLRLDNIKIVSGSGGTITPTSGK